MLRRNGYNARVIKRVKNKFMVYIKNNPNKEPATMKSVDNFINKIDIEDTGNTIPTKSIENENSEILNDKSAVDIYQSKDGKKIFQIFQDEVLCSIFNSSSFVVILVTSNSLLILFHSGFIIAI
jgi:hypothetical protein